MIHYESQFCTDGDPYGAKVPGSWDERDVSILKIDGTIIFQQKKVLAPTTWSDLAVQVVAQKYFRGKVNEDGTPAEGRETSIAQLIDRVVETIADWAGYRMYDGSNYNRRPSGTEQYFSAGAYFDSAESWQAWRDDLKWLLVNQHLCFNSPVWFNFGIEQWPQGAACFLVRMEDHMEGVNGILDAATTEGRIFRGGSGSGINLSRLRSEKEWLSGGGRPSGPMSFAKTLDTQAGVIKSGGKSRRAAKMLLMDVDHPDIRQFIHCKAKEEGLAKTLIDAGYPADMDGFAYEHAFHQNSNLSVRVNDLFMEKVQRGEFWDLVTRTEHFQTGPRSGTMLGIIGRVIERVNAKDLMLEVASRAWECGDPGIQFHDTINAWHTCPNDDLIYTSNPCSEYLHIDNTSCNLASLNLKKFFTLESFNVEGFCEAVRALVIAMDVIVSGAKYPTTLIQETTNKYRTLGVGYANLGGMLMSLGIPYDSDGGRALAAAITSIMSATGYATSALLAHQLGPFEAYERNSVPISQVLQKHLAAAKAIKPFSWIRLPDSKVLFSTAVEAWQVVLDHIRSGSGIRNAQISVLAPTGTIGFMMDCETTGVEPEIGLVKYKTLAGGGTLTIPNPSLAENIQTLTGCSHETAEKIARDVAHGANIRQIIGEDAEVFRTSFPPANDPDFALPWQAHVDMMAAVQPFISGAISKTINMPNSVTPEDVLGAYQYAWKKGLKSIAIYRDGSKGVQAISTKLTADGATGISNKDLANAQHDIAVAEIERIEGNLKAASERVQALEELIAGGISVRRKAPNEVNHVRIRFEIESHKGYLFVGFFEDGKPCEIFVTLSKTGSALQGFTNAFCICFSMLLQYGVPLEKLVQQFQDTEFEPKGVLKTDMDVRICRSVVDYIVRKVQAVSERGGRYHLAEVADLPDVDDPLPPPPITTPPIPVGGVTTQLPHTPTSTPRRSGKVCRCGSFDVVVIGKCYICKTCGSEEGGCFG
jgi:ribonucleoside-diphosphate reductase alpha chain